MAVQPRQEGNAFLTAVAGDTQENLRADATAWSHSRRPKPVSWAWLDLNQRPHPSQAYSREVFLLEERDRASSAVGWQ